MKWAMAMVVVSLVRLMAAPVDWMPRSEDGTQLWWQDGAPKIMNSDQAPASEILCFKYGTKQLRFDTRNIRLLDTRWDCSLVVAGQRYECRGRAERKDEFFQPVRFVECGKWFHRVVIDELTFADAQGRAYQEGHIGNFRVAGSCGVSLVVRGCRDSATAVR